MRFFVTICTNNRENLFGSIVDVAMQLSDGGLTAEKCWLEIPAHFSTVELDAFVIIPNHVHGIIVVVDVWAKDIRAKDVSPLRGRPVGTSGTIGSIVRGFKIGVTKWFRQHGEIHEVWQRNYWEHIIRDDAERDRFREYISNNPATWDLDKLNPITYQL